MINQMKGEYICEFGDWGRKKKKRRERENKYNLTVI